MADMEEMAAIKEDIKEDQPAAVSSSPLEGSGRQRAARRLWRAQTAYLMMLAAFAVLAVCAHVYSYFGWDQTAELWLQSLPLPGMARLMTFVSLFGNGLTPWALTAATVLLFLARGRRSEAAGLVLSAGGGELINSLIKILIARPRPTTELVQVAVDLRTRSFPSGHVTFYVCYFGFLFFVAYALLPRGKALRRPALFLAALPVALVGLSRVYLGAHWPSDTLGAYLLGGLWLAFSLDMYRRWKRNATMHPELK